MNIKTGIDIVHINRIKKILDTDARDTFIQKYLGEIKNIEPEYIAGLFAVKEAVIKALGTNLNFSDIKIISLESGKPSVKIENNKIKLLGSDISIAHDGEYAIASAVFLVE